MANHISRAMDINTAAFATHGLLLKVTSSNDEHCVER